MYIIGNSKIDKGRRVNVGVFGFKGGDILHVVIDVEDECIRIFNEDDIPDFMKECECTAKVDGKKRIIIPKWIVEKQQLDEKSNLDLVLSDEGEKFIIKV